MKKSISLILLCVCVCVGFASCGSNDDPEVESRYKDVTVEIERNSESLSALEGQCLFTLNSGPVYNKSDWDLASINTESKEYQFILSKGSISLNNKSTFSFKQEKVSFLLQCTYSPKDENADEEDFNVSTKVIVKVDGKVVNTQTVLDLPLNTTILYAEK